MKRQLLVLGFCALPFQAARAQDAPLIAQWSVGKDAPSPLRARDFVLESGFARTESHVPNERNIFVVRVRYVGTGTVKVARLALNQRTFFGTPIGWKVKSTPEINWIAGSINLRQLKNGQYLEGVYPLQDEFSKVLIRTTKIPIRVEVQPFEGDWNPLEDFSNPHYKSTLKRLKPILLTGFVTVSIPPDLKPEASVQLSKQKARPQG